VALKDYREGVYKSFNAAAKAHGVAESTLRGRVNGGKSRSEANEAKQLLFRGEERALVRWVLDVSKSGYPPSKSMLRQMAEEVRWGHISKINDAGIILVEYPSIGEQWVNRFIQR
jgi:Tc5 transposase DNA-binding domain/helix-turn-helix, Psq domain